MDRQDMSKTSFCTEFRRRKYSFQCQYGTSSGDFCKLSLPLCRVYRMFQEPGHTEAEVIPDVVLCTKHVLFKRVNKICRVRGCSRSTTTVYCSGHRIPSHTRENAMCIDPTEELITNVFPPSAMDVGD